MLLSQENLKLKKNEIPTWGLSLVPAKENSFGVNLCINSNIDCRNACIFKSGGARFQKIQDARLAKTDSFLSDTPKFLKQLWAELNYVNLTSDKSLVRLNMFTDIDWFEEFLKGGYNLTTLENIIFYGYTKRPSILESSSKLKNFDCIFSFSGYNWALCEHYLKESICNVSIVFKLKKNQPLPTVWKGFEVINGDESDQRLKNVEGTGKIIALRYKNPVAKGSAKYKPSKFIIEL